MPAASARVRGRSCFVVALDALKAGDLLAAREVLRAPASLTDAELESALHAYRRGAALVGDGKLVQAMEHLVPAARALEGSHEAVVRHLESLMLVAMATVDAARNQAQEARAKLARLEEIMESDAFYDEEVAHLYREIRTVVELADVHAAIMRGDIAGAEHELSEVEALYAKAAEQEPADSPRRLVMTARGHWVRLQMECALAQLQLMNIDLPLARSRLKHAAPHADALRAAIAKLPAPEREPVFDLAVAAHADLSELVALFDDVIVHHRGLDRKRARRLEALRDRIARGAGDAARLGPIGGGMLFIYGWIGRAMQLISESGRHSARADFGRWGGLISLAAALILIPLIRFVIQPTGAEGTTYYGIAITLALIAGFGYGALQFRPMLPWMRREEARSVPVE